MNLSQVVTNMCGLCVYQFYSKGRKAFQGKSPPSEYNRNPGISPTEISPFSIPPFQSYNLNGSHLSSPSTTHGLIRSTG